MAAKKKSRARRGRRSRSSAKSTKRKEQAKRGVTVSTVRPPAQGAPPGIERGTEEYRAWEMSRILSMWAMGMAKSQIVTILDMTEREWRTRVAAIRRETRPGDGLMAWARFIGASRERMQQFMTLYFDARKAGHYAAAVGAARSMADLDARILDMAIRLGLVDPVAPDAEVGPPALSPYAQELESILMWAGEEVDMAHLTEEDFRRALDRIDQEYIAMRHRPRPPSLAPGA